jgi:hypothetical protein
LEKYVHILRSLVRLLFVLARQIQRWRDDFIIDGPATTTNNMWSGDDTIMVTNTGSVWRRARSEPG